MKLGPLSEKGRVVNSLRAWQHFLSSHEHVIRITQFLKKKNKIKKNDVTTLPFVQIQLGTYNNGVQLGYAVSFF